MSLTQKLGKLAVFVQALIRAKRFSGLRACAKIISHFRVPSSGYRSPILLALGGAKIPKSPIVEFLWFGYQFRFFGSARSDLNPDANSVKLLLR